jgi:hypothetical protein
MNSAERKRKHWESMAKLKREHDEDMKGLREVGNVLKNLKEPTDGNLQELMDYGNGVVAAMNKFQEVKKNFHV